MSAKSSQKTLSANGQDDSQYVSLDSLLFKSDLDEILSSARFLSSRSKVEIFELRESGGGTQKNSHCRSQ